MDGLEEALKGLKENKPALPEDGYVLKVIDQNTMLLELDSTPTLPAGERMEDYKMLFIVKGTKGSYVDGQYRVGVKSFEGYPAQLLGKQTVIVEVPEYDLAKEKIEKAGVSIICIKQ